VKRMWAFQPNISRRFFGAHVEHLRNTYKGEALEQILYHAFSVSAIQTADQRMMYPRSVTSKRVNPSSGGLHPVEAYVIHPAGDNTVVAHYMPFSHGKKIEIIGKPGILFCSGLSSNNIPMSNFFIIL